MNVCALLDKYDFKWPGPVAEGKSVHGRFREGGREKPHI